MSASDGWRGDVHKLVSLGFPVALSSLSSYAMQIVDVAVVAHALSANELVVRVPSAQTRMHGRARATGSH
jgi:Na+-driven multidrug efflux pump